eukprot:Skav212386  [mRNA]  locus=scaffold45:45781:52198:- [translate_table: standard]
MLRYGVALLVVWCQGVDGVAARGRLHQMQQAFKRVENLEASEDRPTDRIQLLSWSGGGCIASLKQELAENNRRVGQLEEALKKEQNERMEVAKENLHLNGELQREELKSSWRQSARSSLDQPGGCHQQEAAARPHEQFGPISG